MSIKRVCFTGHRPEKIAGWSENPEAIERSVRAALAEEIVRCVADGAERFLCGMAPGFDLWAADELLRLRALGGIGGDVELVAVVPHEGFSRTFDEASKVLYEEVLAAASEVVTLSPHYYHQCYARRNRYLVDNADFVVAYYEGCSGGTRQTIDYARKQGRGVVNLHQPTLFP